MAQEQEFVTEFNGAVRRDWTTLSDYDEVNALLIYWEDDDLNVAPEVTRLQRLFEKEFKFKVYVYRIPTKNCGLEFQSDFTSFTKQHSTSKTSLTIIYYAGHADPPDKNEPGYSKWRAKCDGGPLLNWYFMQPLLYDASGDVLVILDCCHAALKTRGSKEGKMEILAACGSGSRVPKPGKLSFTSILIGQLKAKVSLGQTINIRSLAALLWSDKLDLTETPVYFDLSDHDQRSIVLKQLQPITAEGFTRKTRPVTSFMILKVSLNDDPKGLQIAEWLKSFPPSVIHNVDIEALVLKARRLQDIQEYSTFFPGSILGRLSAPAQNEILQGLWSLSQVVSSTSALASGQEANLNSSLLQEVPRENFATRIIRNFQDKVQDVCNSIEEAILLSTEVPLEEAAKDEAVIVAEAGPSIAITHTVRQYLLDNSFIPDTPELPASSVSFAPTQRGLTSRFRFGRIREQQVVIETVHYVTAAQGSSEPSTNAVIQIKRIVNQLSLPKPNGFSALPCVGYIQERHRRDFGVVFGLPQNCSENKLPTTLAAVYQSKKRVALDTRVKLAYTLATALEHFHRVGWVHKEFKSENIVFFGTNSDIEVNLVNPWLFGFESSRPEDAESEMKTDFSAKNNAHRHPERWGKPAFKFVKSHDVYSLGIMCLELVLWKPAIRFDEMKPKQSDALDPWEVKEKLLEKVKQDIPHMAGQFMADAIEACLRFKETTDDLSSFDIHQQFKSRILSHLKKGLA